MIYRGFEETMANIKTGFIRGCKYLQDPHLVAKFQQICGVRGTFSPKPEADQKQQHNGASMNHWRGESENAKGDSEERIGGLRLRQNTTAGNSPDDCKQPLPNGITGELEAGDAAGQSRKTCSTRDGEVARESPPDGAPDTGIGRAWGTSEHVAGEQEESKSRVMPLRKNSLTGDVGQEFIIENKFLFYLFTFGTELGNEMFFIIFFPFLIWNVDVYVSRRLLVVWVWVLYLGQSTKDIIRWTRPASPPVVKVEVFYNSEYSMPSTHAMSGTAVPFSLFLLSYGRWEYPFALGLGLAVCWSFLVCTSRVYMGMHSVLEVITGFLYSILILAVFQPVLDEIDSFTLTCRYAPLIIAVLHVGLGLAAFSLDSWSTSRADTAQALGTGVGAAMAAHLNHQLGLTPDPPAVMLPFSAPPLSLALVARSLLRHSLGVAVLLATRAVMKALTIPLVCRVFGVPCDDVRRARQHMEVELPYRYIVYGTVGFNCLFLVPLVFSYLNLS